MSHDAEPVAGRRSLLIAGCPIDELVLEELLFTARWMAQ